MPACQGCPRRFFCMKTNLDEGNACEGSSGCLGGISPAEPPPPKAWFSLSPRGGQQHGDGKAGFRLLSAARSPSPCVSFTVFWPALYLAGSSRAQLWVWGLRHAWERALHSQEPWPVFTCCLSEKKNQTMILCYFCPQSTLAVPPNLLCCCLQKHWGGGGFQAHSCVSDPED